MSELIEQARIQVDSSRDYLRKTFISVPDEKLNWSPSATAKSAQRIMVHTVTSNFGLARFIRGEASPFKDLAAMEEYMKEQEAKVTSRAQVLDQLDASVEVVLSALGTLTTSRIASTAQTPFGAMPMRELMFIPAIHMSCHASQIDYLQTVWGDLAFHM